MPRASTVGSIRNWAITVKGFQSSPLLYTDLPQNRFLTDSPKSIGSIYIVKDYIYLPGLVAQTNRNEPE